MQEGLFKEEKEDIEREEKEEKEDKKQKAKGEIYAAGTF